MCSSIFCLLSCLNHCHWIFYHHWSSGHLLILSETHRGVSDTPNSKFIISSTGKVAGQAWHAPPLLLFSVFMQFIYSHPNEQLFPFSLQPHLFDEQPVVHLVKISTLSFIALIFDSTFHSTVSTPSFIHHPYWVICKSVISLLSAWFHICRTQHVR